MAQRFLTLRIAGAYREAKGASAVSVGNGRNSKTETFGRFDMDLPPHIHQAELTALILALQIAKEKKDEMPKDPIFTILTRSKDLVKAMTEDGAMLERCNIKYIDIIRDAVELEDSVTGRRLGPEKAWVQYVCVPKEEVKKVQWQAQRVADGFFPVTPSIEGSPEGQERTIEGV